MTVWFNGRMGEIRIYIKVRRTYSEKLSNLHKGLRSTNLDLPNDIRLVVALIMYSPVLFFVTALAAFMPWTFAQNSTPAAPGLTYLYTLNCTLLPPYIIGAGPRGFRVAIPITGGYFNGPKLSGKLIGLYTRASLIHMWPPVSSET